MAVVLKSLLSEIEEVLRHGERVSVWGPYKVGPGLAYRCPGTVNCREQRASEVTRTGRFRRRPGSQRPTVAQLRKDVEAQGPH
jgi:hypothetical protein